MNDTYSDQFDLENQGDLGQDAKINKLINKYGKQNHSKGLAALLKIGDPIETPKVTQTKKVETVTTQLQNFDPMVMNEILRVVREKNEKIEGRFNLLESQIQNLKRFHWQDKRMLTALVTACLLIGVIVGNMLAPESNYREPAVIVNKVEKTNIKNQMVTKKFVNMRAKNSPRAKKVITLSPAQVVTVLERKGGWVKVSFHNKLTGKKYSGYVWDEYLTGVR